MAHSVPPANRPRLPGGPWSVFAAATFLSISPRHLFRMIDRGQAKSLRLGKRVLLADAEVRRLAEKGTD